MDHMHGDDPEGPWTAGWLVAGGAGLVAAFLARVIGDVGMMAALVVAAVVFLVFGVLLGLFWGNPAVDGDHDHGHDHHPAAAPTPVAAVPVMEPVAPGMPVAEPVALAEPLTPEPEEEPLPSLADLEPLVAAEPPSVADPVPVAQTPPVEGGTKPQALTEARGGMPDDLQVIEGIGPALEKLCHDLGIYHFDQIADWGPAEIAWMDGNLKGFRGRVTRDKWVAQAKVIGTEGVEAFLIRAKTNDY